MWVSPNFMDNFHLGDGCHKNDDVGMFHGMGHGVNPKLNLRNHCVIAVLDIKTTFSC